jgi:hypothetical protein
LNQVLAPNVIAWESIKSLSSAGQKLPGGLSEIVTPTAFYLKWSVLTAQLGAGKPWVAIPVSSLSKGLDYLSGSTKTQLKQAIASAGFKTATFTVWIDGQNLIRKYNVTEAGPTVSETIGITLNTINQPVNIAAPPASQTTTLPGSDLSGPAG